MPKFDRLPEFDEKSLAFPIRTVAPQKWRSYTWRCDFFLDQGREGACVGFGWAQEACARPKVIPLDNSAALRIYHRAKELDQWPGEDYDGTSVIAGAKACQEFGYIGEYRWAFTLSDLVNAVGHIGPAVLGWNWYADMFEPDENGLIWPTGDLLGGHCILCIGVNITEKTFTLHNSWGYDWGRKGTCKIKFEAVEFLMRGDQQGDACIPLERKFVR